jgi:hypothetical protein
MFLKNRQNPSFSLLIYRIFQEECIIIRELITLLKIRRKVQKKIGPVMLRWRVIQSPRFHLKFSRPTLFEMNSYLHFQGIK